MKKNCDMIQITSDKEWIRDVQKYRVNEDWISIVDKFALAVFRLLRYEEKSIDWLAQEMHLTVNDLRANINGTEEVTLKTLIRIQNILGTEILSVRNIDLYLQYKDYKVIFYNEEASYEISVTHLSLKNFQKTKSWNNFIKEIDYEYEEYTL